MLKDVIERNLNIFELNLNLKDYKCNSTQNEILFASFSFPINYSVH